MEFLRLLFLTLIPWGKYCVAVSFKEIQVTFLLKKSVTLVTITVTGLCPQAQASSQYPYMKLS